MIAKEERVDTCSRFYSFRRSTTVFNRKEKDSIPCISEGLQAPRIR
jgi:hypothetical protein